MWEARNRRRNRRLDEGRRSVMESPKAPVDDATSLLAVLQECIAERTYFKASFMKLVQYLRSTDFKHMNLQFLSEDSCFFVLRSLNSWVVDIYTESRNDELPSHILTLTEFYRFAVRNFKSRIQSERMWVAYSYFLNNMALVSLRLKQYSKCIDYLENVAEIYEEQCIPHCIFSIACANLATLYRRLNDLSTAEYYIGQAANIAKQLMNQMITDRVPDREIEEVANLLATVYVSMNDVLKESGKLKEVERIVLELVEKNFVKLTNRIWYVKNFVDKIRKGPAYRPFHSTFTLNLEEFRFYGEVGRGQTPPTVTRMHPINLPPINSQFNYSAQVPTPATGKKERIKNLNLVSPSANNRYGKAQQPSPVDNSLKVPHQPVDTSVFSNTHYRKQIKDQYSAIESQNKELKHALDVILRKQADTENVLQSIILPKIVDFVQNAPAIAPFSNVNPVLTSLQSKTLQLNGVVFKNLRVNLQFASEGVIINSFSGGGQQKLQWSSIKYILNNLEHVSLFEHELDMANNQHQLAKLLFNYIDVEKNHIKIGRYPTPVFSLKVSPTSYLQFYYVHERQFQLAYLVNNKLDYVLRCQFCEKSFSKYFRLHKFDEYYEDVKQRMLGVYTKKRQFYASVVKYNDNESLENALINIVVNLQIIVDDIVEKHRNSTAELPLVKLSLEFDQYENSHVFRGNVSIIVGSDEEKHILVTIHNLNATVDDTPQSKVLVRKLPYWQLLEDYGLKYEALTQYYRYFVKLFVCDLYQMRNDTITIHNKSKRIVYLNLNPVETSYYIQTFIDQKYYRPVRMSVVGANKKIHGLRFGLYNECSHQEESFFVICQSDMDRPRHSSLTRADVLKQSMLTKLLKRIDLGSVIQKYKKLKADLRRPIIHLETFLQMFM